MEPDADPEDQDEYKAENVFWVPPAARWSYLQDSAKQATIELIDLIGTIILIDRTPIPSPGSAGASPAVIGAPADQPADLPLAAETPSREYGAKNSHRSKDISRPRLRILPRPIRQRRGQERRPVLHPAERRAIRASALFLQS